MSLDVDRLDESDLDAARSLSTEAGWNQTRADWARLRDLFPETCFAGRVDGELVATSTLAVHGDVGWVGMVLVREAHRRRGYGSAMFERALAAARDRGLRTVGLDATDAGRAVYEGYDFREVGAVDRWSGDPPPDALDVPGDRAGSVRPWSATSVSADAVAEFDRRRCESDRGRLLGHLLRAPETTGLVSERAGALRGYAVLRPGRTRSHLGPVVADDRADAAALLAAGVRRADDGVVVDAVRRGETTALLERASLDVSRRLHRMTRGEPRAALDGEAVVAAAGFEWG